MIHQKQWWAPVWKGLAVDTEGRHYHKMKVAVWLFLYLVFNADRKTGLLLRKIKTITTDMGVRRDTVTRWLDILRVGGYIATRSTGRCLNIQINKWRVSEVRNMPHQKRNLSDARGWIYPASENLGNGDSGAKLSQKTSHIHSPIDISINRDIINNDIDKKPGNRTFNNFSPQTKTELLAIDLADALDDRNNLPLYLSYAKRYPEQLLRNVMGEVREIPFNKIKKSHGALFNHLVQKYAAKQ